MHHPTDRIAHTMAFVIPAVEDWLEKNKFLNRSTIRKRSDDLSFHDRTLYNGATSRS